MSSHGVTRIRTPMLAKVFIRPTLLWSMWDLRLHKDCDRCRESPLVIPTNEPTLPDNKTRWCVKRILAQVGNTRQECYRNRLVEEKTALICHPCSHRQNCLAGNAVVINAIIVRLHAESPLVAADEVCMMIRYMKIIYCSGLTESALRAGKLHRLSFSSLKQMS